MWKKLVVASKDKDRFEDDELRESDHQISVLGAQNKFLSKMPLRFIAFENGRDQDIRVNGDVLQLTCVPYVCGTL